MRDVYVHVSLCLLLTLLLTLLPTILLPPFLSPVPSPRYGTILSGKTYRECTVPQWVTSHLSSGAQNDGAGVWRRRGGRREANLISRACDTRSRSRSPRRMPPHSCRSPLGWLRSRNGNCRTRGILWEGDPYPAAMSRLPLGTPLITRPNLFLGWRSPRTRWIWMGLETEKVSACEVIWHHGPLRCSTRGTLGGLVAEEQQPCRRRREGLGKDRR